MEPPLTSPVGTPLDTRTYFGNGQHFTQQHTARLQKTDIVPPHDCSRRHVVWRLQQPEHGTR